MMVVWNLARPREKSPHQAFPSQWTSYGKLSIMVPLLREPVKAAIPSSCGAPRRWWDSDRSVEPNKRIKSFIGTYRYNKIDDKMICTFRLSSWLYRDWLVCNSLINQPLKCTVRLSGPLFVSTEYSSGGP